jgi:catechol 2,3-dioxygenase-like lactoylglutathione lyase family enzyme
VRQSADGSEAVAPWSLIDHVHLIARDLAASKRFYAAALGALGRRIEGEGEHYFWSDELFVSTADQHTRSATRVHLAFQARDRAAVERFHSAAIAAGGQDNGAPGLRPYHPDYYAAFVIDPTATTSGGVPRSGQRLHRRLS